MDQEGPKGTILLRYTIREENVNEILLERPLVQDRYRRKAPGSLDGVTASGPGVVRAWCHRTVENQNGVGRFSAMCTSIRNRKEGARGF